MAKKGPMAYELALHMHVRVHNVFHESLLKKYVYETKHVINWSLLHVDPEGEFTAERLQISDKREVQLQKCTVVQLKVQWKHFEVDEATWENEATMRKAYLAFFLDIIHSPQNTRDDVVLSGEGCKIPNFGPTIYRHEHIDQDDYIDDLFYILGVSQLLMIYMYVYVGCVWRRP